MTLLPVEHATFVIERSFAYSTRHAFRFWAEARLKKLWTSCHEDWLVLEDIFDFRVGGSEGKRWRTPDGHEQTFLARYLDIVPERRIIYAYDMGLRGVKISASLVTIELSAADAGTQMRFTEQAVFLDGGSSEERVRGTGQGFDRLAEVMRHPRMRAH